MTEIPRAGIVADASASTALDVERHARTRRRERGGRGRPSATFPGRARAVFLAVAVSGAVPGVVPGVASGAAPTEGAAPEEAAPADALACADIRHLIARAGSGFTALRGDAAGGGAYRSTFVLPGARHCAIGEGVGKASYRCTWEFPLGDERARARFRGLVDATRRCLGDEADERTDRPLNHPDFYASHHFGLPSGEVRVSLKDKGASRRTLVALTVEGSATPK